MANRCDPMDNISPVRECWRIKARVVRLWTLPSFNNPETINSIEMVLMDEFGCTMHATVRRTLVYKFKPLLSEGQFYVLAYFGVGANTGSFRTTRHDFRLNFQLRTTVRPSENVPIPIYGLKLVSFEDILQSDAQFPYLIDTMGVLIAVGTEKEYDKDGKKTRMIIIQLEADNLKLEVALFGNFVDEVNNFIANSEVQRPVIVIQFGKINSFRGNIVVQNVMFGTRLLFNPEIAEVLEFKKGLPPVSPECSQSVSILSGTPSYSLEEDFLNQTPRKKIQELNECSDGYYIVIATVDTVSSRLDDWWYPACKCNKAVRADEGMYYCERCFCHVVNVIPRYKVKLSVLDGSGSSTFVLFDREASTVLKKSCSYMLECIQKLNMIVPPEFDEYLIQHEFLFKIEVKQAFSNQFQPSFKIARVCSDSSIIEKFKANTIDPKMIVNHSEPEYSPENNFLKNTSRASIEDLKDSKFDGIFVVLATVKQVNSRTNWWYPECKRSHRVTPDSGLYFYDKCNIHVFNVCPRNHINLRVMDRSDSATFVLGDVHACQLLKKSCAALFGSLTNDAISGGLPTEFESHLHDKEFLFKIKINPDDVKVLEPSFMIVDVCKDPTVISKFKESDPKLQSIELGLTAGVSIGDQSLGMESKDIQSSFVAKDLLKDFNDGMSAEFSETANVAPDITPTKRSSMDSEPIEVGNASSSKMKIVKIEKD